MTEFHLVRHGEPDYDMLNHLPLSGWGWDVAPLTKQGVVQAKMAAQQLSTAQAEIIISSPMTRALQTGMIISNYLQIPAAVEFGLHEWIPDKNFI